VVHDDEILAIPLVLELLWFDPELQAGVESNDGGKDVPQGVVAGFDPGVFLFGSHRYLLIAGFGFTLPYSITDFDGFRQMSVHMKSFGKKGNYLYEC
jgi:hypothetical protein